MLPSRRSVQAACLPAGGVLTRVDQGSANAAPLHQPDDLQAMEARAAGRCWRTMGTSAGSRIGYRSPTDGLSSQATTCSGWSGKARGRAVKRRVSVTCWSRPPGPAAPVPPWAMHAGLAAASSRAGETDPPGPDLMRSP